MGEGVLTDEIFEFIDNKESKLSLYLVHLDGIKMRVLDIKGYDFANFNLNKPLARKIVRELIKEFKLKEFTDPKQEVKK